MLILEMGAAMWDAVGCLAEAVEGRSSIESAESWALLQAKARRNQARRDPLRTATNHS